MKSLVTASFVILSLAVTSVSFSAEMPDEQPQVEAMRDGGTPFVVSFHSESCLICRVQSTALREAAQSPDFMGITLFTVQFRHREVIRTVSRDRQAERDGGFKDDKETARAAGLAHYDSLSGIVQHAVASP